MEREDAILKGLLEIAEKTTVNDSYQIPYEITKETDMWFHVHNESSCHVIAVIPGDNTYNKKQLAKIIIQGALCCKQHSKAKNKQAVEICYSRLINIVKTDVVGQVYMKEYRTTVI